MCADVYDQDVWRNADYEVVPIRMDRESHMRKECLSIELANRMTLILLLLTSVLQLQQATRWPAWSQQVYLPTA